MAYSNKMVDSMIHSQFDAFKNMYDIELQWPSVTGGSLAGSQEVVSIRAKGIKIPDFEIATYERHYHGGKINLPKPEQTFDRQIEITFTMDSAFQYYQLFCQWASICGDPVTGGTANSLPTDFLGRITVVPLSGNYLANTKVSSDGSVQQPDYVGTGANEKTNSIEAGKITDGKLYWGFDRVWVTRVTAPDFAVDSSEPLEFAVTFQFLDYDAPAYGGFRSKQAVGAAAPTIIGQVNKGAGTLSSGTGGTGTGTGEGDGGE